jgi:hypothetical protein
MHKLYYPNVYYISRATLFEFSNGCQRLPTVANGSILVILVHMFTTAIVLGMLLQVVMTDFLAHPGHQLKWLL